MNNPTKFPTVPGDRVYANVIYVVAIKGDYPATYHARLLKLKNGAFITYEDGQEMLEFHPDKLAFAPHLIDGYDIVLRSGRTQVVRSQFARPDHYAIMIRLAGGLRRKVPAASPQKEPA